MSGLIAILHVASGALVHAGWPIIFVAGLVIASLIARYGLRRRWHARIERKRLMTAAEVRFWHVLIRAFPDHGVFVLRCRRARCFGRSLACRGPTGGRPTAGSAR